MRPRQLVLLILFALSGCDTPQRTAAELRKDIDSYKQSPDEQTRKRIDANLARLTEQIAGLEARGKSTEAASLRSTAENLRSDYRAARIVEALDNARSAIKQVGDAFQDAGKALENAFAEPRQTQNP